jgi:hypothetical protein
MNETARELDMIRTQLRAGIERDLHDRSPRSRVTHRRSIRIAIPTLAVLAVATTAIVLGLTVSAASPSSASAAAQRALAATAAAPSGAMTTTVLHAGVTHTIDAARWNGSDIAFSPGVGPHTTTSQAPPRSRSSPSPPTCRRRLNRMAPPSTAARSRRAASIQGSLPAMTPSRA